MKTKRILFIVFGWLFILFNAMAYLGSIVKREPVFEDKSIPYILGYNILFIAGFAFLFFANKQKRKMKEQKEKEVMENFLVPSTTAEDHSS